ncbi:MAG: type II toxin-antitoxin system RnlA family toxin [Nitrosomonas ureae]
MSDYKNLNLNRETLEVNIEKFLNTNQYESEGEIQTIEKGRRVVFGTAGSEFAMVDLLFNNTGTTTIHWKTGKNHALGEKLAIFLKSTIDPAEFETVNYALSGITIDSINSIIEILSESKDFNIDTRSDDKGCKKITLQSISYQDQITVTHHKSTRKLQIQGKPLSCYRRLVYLLTDLLDLKGLEQVLYRKDDSSAEVVRKEMAEDYLKGFFTSSYDCLPCTIKKLLISSCCVKLASPQLPDYSLLLYPDLRALEGSLREKMKKYQMCVAEADNGFGDFFDCRSGICTLKEEHKENIACSNVVNALNDAYSFYRKHRNTLFHMEDYVEISRMIDTLDKAIGLSKDTYKLINRLYTPTT